MRCVHILSPTESTQMQPAPQETEEKTADAASESQPVKTGDWAVWDDGMSWHSNPRYECGEVVKVTPRTMTYKGRGRDIRRDIGGTLWSGSEPDARALVERLSSSAGLMIDETRRSRERHKSRVDELIAKATAQ
jgi:hypothetical protein